MLHRCTAHIKPTCEHIAQAGYGRAHLNPPPSAPSASAPSELRLDSARGGGVGNRPTHRPDQHTVAPLPVTSARRIATLSTSPHRPCPQTISNHLSYSIAFDTRMSSWSWDSLFHATWYSTIDPTHKHTSREQGFIKRYIDSSWQPHTEAGAAAGAHRPAAPT
jgi:hypothetical protein